MPDWMGAILAAVLGLVFGSFANVVIWRFPRGESLSHPASHCPGCDTPIRWRDNVPVVSWLLLRGRCRDCGQPISVRYPAVEVLSGVLWLLAFLIWGYSLSTIFAAFAFYLLLILAFIDLDTMRLPNGLVALLAVGGIIGVAISHFLRLPAVPLLPPVGPTSLTPITFALLGVALGAGMPLAVSGLYRLVRGRAGIGMGDVKLLAVLGIYFGPYVLINLFLGSAIGAIYAVAAGFWPQKERKIPFGPFLAGGAVLTALLGRGLWAWYASVL